MQLLDKHIYICINFYSYSKIDTDENNMKIKNVNCVVDYYQKG